LIKKYIDIYCANPNINIKILRKVDKSMSIFGKGYNNSTVTAPVYEGYGVDVNGDILAITESFDDQLEIVKALHAIDMEELAMRSDVRQLRESGADISAIEERQQQYEAVTEGMVKNAYQKIKEFFSKLWGKIKAFFGSVVRYFDGIFKSSQEFAKKYEPQLRKLDLHGFKYKMHTYTNLDELKGVEVSDRKQVVAQIFEGLKDFKGESEEDLKGLRDTVDELRNNKDEILAQMRGQAVGKGPLTSEEFAEELYKLFRNGASSDDDMEEQPVEIEKILAVLKDTKAKKEVEDFAKKVDDEFSKILKDINDIERKVATAKEKDGSLSVKHAGHEASIPTKASSLVLENLRLAASFTSASKDMQMQFFRAWRAAYAERDSVYKRVCLAAFRYKRK
jgi:hypothetical protein